jgi:alkanesulfonate monooxygenase SsuD/methylene tetrahydromethanopterin reductase-like flavin-dependent oxidoreductase (luciferase family)
LPVDPVLSRELNSLQEELVAVQQRRREPAPSPRDARISSSVMPTPDDTTTLAAATQEETLGAASLRDQLGEFVDQITDFFEDAEKNIAAHPTESVIAALLLGILIGRLLGRG